MEVALTLVVNERGMFEKEKKNGRVTRRSDFINGAYVTLYTGVYASRMSFTALQGR